VTAQQIEALHDFYSVVATAGAAAAGFVYVAVSINAKTIGRHENDWTLFYVVHVTVFSFVALVIVALGFLWRPADAHVVSLALLIAGGIVATAAGAASRAWNSSTLFQTHTTRATVTVPLAISIACIALALVSWFIPDWLVAIPVVLFVLTFTALGSVWGLLSGLAAIELSEDEPSAPTTPTLPSPPPESFYGRWLRSYRGWDPTDPRARRVVAERRREAQRDRPDSSGAR